MVQMQYAQINFFIDQEISQTTTALVNFIAIFFECFISFFLLLSIIKAFADRLVYSKRKNVPN